MKLRGYALLPLAVLASGCAATFSDRHYFATVREDTGEVVNVFRVKVEGNADFTNARYISGFYDERAVDLFFNEIKPSNTKFFDYGCANPSDADCEEKKNNALKTVPVGKSAGEQGAFVMILSTDADAITDTIGSFAESDALVQSAAFLANRDAFVEARQVDAISETVAEERAATYNTLSQLVKVGATSAPDREQKYLAMLRLIAGALAPEDAPQFTTPKEAQVWFSSRPRKEAK